ncbi:hypothetical protein OG758_15035 [Streptomyces sp. NBC_01474]|nr:MULTISPECIES: hypothetical protein [unclassified Streptomyces]WSD95320.1 hypothetical protein OG758_15035 [Streptomyces sp. NBC_01474]
MTEEFAGAMVTVIPIILLLAGVEWHNRVKDDVDKAKQRLEKLRRGESAPYERPPMWRYFLDVVWVALVVSHGIAEAYLITWLAGTERPAAPGWADFIATTGGAGFLLVILLGLGPAVARFGRLRDEADQLEEALNLQMAGQSDHVSTQRPPSSP